MACPICGGPPRRSRVILNTEDIACKVRSSFGPLISTHRGDVTCLLSDAKTDLADYDAQISRLESSLILLKQKRDRLQKYVVNCQSLLAPIRLLPPEILSHILLLCCEMNIFDPANKVDLPAFTLSAVCSYWRNIAIATPRLWATLMIPFHTLMLRNPSIEPNNLWLIPLMVPAIQLCLQRSAEAPLTLELSAFTLDDFDDYDGIMRELVRQSHRWYHVKVDIQDSPFLNSPGHDLISLVTSAPCLEILELEQDNEEDFTAALHACNFAPRLHTLSLTSFCPPSTAPLPWTQITTLNLDCINHVEVLKLLQICSHVTNLSLHSIQFDEANSFNDCSVSVVSNRISSVTLGLSVHPWMIRVSTLDALLSRLTLPSLCSLAIVSAQGEITNSGKESWPIKSFASFFMRSRCSITSLTIQNTPISDTEIISLLRFVPNLRELNICDCSLPRTVTDKFLQAMHTLNCTNYEATSQIPLVPRLKSINFRVQDLSFDPAKFIDMVRSRWIPEPEYASQIGISSLKSVKLLVKEGEVECAFRSLSQLDGLGLQVEILTI